MNKTSRRQMAFTSLQNLISHIGTVAYSNSSPCATIWESYYNVSKSAQELMGIIETVIGTFVKPINPAFTKQRLFKSLFLMWDCTKYYKDNSYSRVKVDAIDDLNRSSIVLLCACTA